MVCKDPLAATCNEFNPEKSLTCKSNAELFEIGPYFRCTCSLGFFFNLQVSTCDACDASCDGLCDGPGSGGCQSTVYVSATITDSSGVNKFSNLGQGIEEEYEGIIEFKGNEGKVSTYDYTTNALTLVKTITDTRTEGIEDPNLELRVERKFGYTILLGTQVRAISPDLNSANPFFNFNVPSTDGYYYAYSSQPSRNYFFVAMNEAPDPAVAGAALTKILRYDLSFNKEDPVEQVAHREINKIVHCLYTVYEYSVVIYKETYSDNDAYGASFPKRGLFLADRLNNVTLIHNYHYTYRSEEGIDGAFGFKDQQLFFLLTSPLTISTRYLSNGVILGNVETLDVGAAEGFGV
jgi:hypothetical protein